MTVHVLMSVGTYLTWDYLLTILFILKAIKISTALIFKLIYIKGLWDGILQVLMIWVLFDLTLFGASSVYYKGLCVELDPMPLLSCLWKHRRENERQT